MGKRSVYDALNDVVWQSTTYVVRKPWFERCVYIWQQIMFQVKRLVESAFMLRLIEQVAALSFGGYVYFNPDTPLTAQKIFVSLTLIDIIRHPINFIPHAITVITVTVSGQTFISGIIY